MTDLDERIKEKIQSYPDLSAYEKIDEKGRVVEYKFKRKSKAYKCYQSHPEGIDTIVYSNSYMNAEKKAKKIIKEEYYALDDFLHYPIHVQDSEQDDIVHFEGKLYKRSEARRECIRAERFVKRLNLLLNSPEGTMFCIQNSYVGNAILFWGHKGSGYTCNIDKIGKYTKEEVFRRFMENGRDEDTVWVYDHVINNAIKVADNQYLDLTYHA